MRRGTKGRGFHAGHAPIGVARRSRRGRPPRAARRLLLVLVVAFSITVIPAAAAGAAPIWSVTSEALPTAFQPSDTTNKVQRVLVDATGGTFTLSFGGDTTGPIKAPEGSGIESDLDGLTSIGGVGASVSVAESKTPVGSEEKEVLVSF